MAKSFRNFLDSYLEIWRMSSIDQLREIISRDYQAREIRNGEIEDFGYEESIQGWEQGFTFVRENDAQWILNEHSVVPLRSDECLVILSATMTIDGKDLDTSHLFFQTFTKSADDRWQLVRSYIETGVANENIKNFSLVNLNDA
ncbi:flavoprotein [Pseudoneobacillus sp. C159]